MDIVKIAQKAQKLITKYGDNLMVFIPINNGYQVFTKDGVRDGYVKSGIDFEKFLPVAVRDGYRAAIVEVSHLEEEAQKIDDEARGWYSETYYLGIIRKK